MTPELSVMDGIIFPKWNYLKALGVAGASLATVSRIPALRQDTAHCPSLSLGRAEGSGVTHGPSGQRCRHWRTPPTSRVSASFSAPALTPRTWRPEDARAYRQAEPSTAQHLFPGSVKAPSASNAPPEAGLTWSLIPLIHGPRQCSHLLSWAFSSFPLSSPSSSFLPEKFS